MQVRHKATQRASRTNGGAVKATAKKPAILFEETQAIVTRLQKRLDATFISFWNSVQGSICHNDVVVLHQLLRKARPGQSVMFFVKSDGGNGQASLRMVNLVRTYFKQVTALVPLNCESAATMFVLGADEIRMGSMAFLSAVDSSLRHSLSPVDKDNDLVSVGANELARVLRQWREEASRKDANPFSEIYKYIHPLVIGAVDRMDSLSVKLCEEILSFHMKDKAKIKRIAHSLNNDFPSHGYPILLREAKRLGLDVTPLDRAIERDLIELNELYSAMGKRHRTDYDEHNHHDTEVVSIHETAGAMTFFQIDKDWHWRESDRTWISTNDQSKWRTRERIADKVVEDELHIR